MAKQIPANSAFKASIVEQVGISVRWLAGCVALVMVFKYAAEIASHLGGKTTNASIIMSFLAEVEVNIWMAWGLAVAGVVYGNSQRMLRRRVIAEQHDHIEALERQLERRRTSSQLTKHGDTNPMDR